MAQSLPIAFAPVLFKDDDLLVPVLVKDLRDNAGIIHLRPAGSDPALGRHKIDVGDLDRRTGLSVEFLDLDNVSRRDPVLLSARINDSVNVHFS